MSQMADVITKDSVHRLYDAFVEGVLKLERTKAGDLILNRHTFQEVGEPIIRFIHSKLWEASRTNDTGRFIDFPRITQKSIQSVLADEGVTHLGKKRKTGSGHEFTPTVSLGADASRVMQNAGIALYRRPTWYLKPYSSERIQWWTTESGLIRPDYRDEKRRVEEEEKAEATLSSSIDLRQIQRPKEFTPEAVAAFIERFVPAALKLQDRYEKLQEIHATLLEDLASRADEAQWRSVADKIEKMLG